MHNVLCKPHDRAGLEGDSWKWWHKVQTSKKSILSAVCLLSVNAVVYYHSAREIPFAFGLDHFTFIRIYTHICTKSQTLHVLDLLFTNLIEMLRDSGNKPGHLYVKAAKWPTIREKSLHVTKLALIWISFVFTCTRTNCVVSGRTLSAAVCVKFIANYEPLCPCSIL